MLILLAPGNSSRVELGGLPRVRSRDACSATEVALASVTSFGIVGGRCCQTLTGSHRHATKTDRVALLRRLVRGSSLML